MIRKVITALCFLSAAAAAAVTDSERLSVYHDFRAAFDTRNYRDALPLAARLVSMTETQYGASDRALINPLSNLGTTQYRLHDLSAAEETFLRTVKLAESSVGSADRSMLRPLHGLGATYFASAQYEDASLILKRALDLSRNLDGLFNLEQLSILEPLIDSLVALNRHDEAEREFEYSVQVAEAAYGKSDVHVIRPLERSACWQESVGRYTTARYLHAQALQIAQQAEGSGSLPTVEPLDGIARTYRLEFTSGADSALAGDPVAVINPDGEQALLLALRTVSKSTPVDHELRGKVLLELGDWYLSTEALGRGLQSYREASQEFGLGGKPSSVAPRQISYRAPMAAASRFHGDRDSMEEHFVEAAFTVTKEGRTADVVVLESDATETQVKTVAGALRKARYSPRIEGGEVVETVGVTYRERLLVKKPRA